MATPHDFPIAIPNDPKLVPERDELADRALRLVVRDQTTYEGAASFLLDVKAMLQRIAGTFDPVIQSANVAHKAALAAKKEHSEPVLLAEKLIKERMGEWAAEQRRIAREEQLRLEREAESKQRALEEERARQEKLQREIAEAERLREAEALEFEGRSDEALAVVDAPLPTLPPPPPPPPVPVVKASVPKVDGVQVRETWDYELVDPAALLTAIFDRKAPAGFVDWNQTSMRQWAQRTKGSEEFPGLRAKLKTGVSGRR